MNFSIFCVAGIQHTSAQCPPDMTDPTVVCPANQILNVIPSSCAANYTIPDPVSDNCPNPTWGYILTGATTGSMINIADGMSSGVLSFNKGNTSVTLTGEDGQNNNAMPCNFMVTVNDNEAPVLNCPSAQSINVVPATCAGLYVIADPITDNCTGATWGYSLTGATTASLTGIADGTGSGGLSFNLGVTMVALSGTDGTNMAAPCNFMVTVNDNEAPTVSCPPNQFLNVNASTCAGSYTIADPVSDNCSAATWGYVLSGVTTGSMTGIADGTGSGVLSFNKGATTVMLSGSDGINSATPCSFTVTVTDNEAPVVTCPSAQSINVVATTCAGAYAIADPVSDNCSGATWGYVLSGVTTGSMSGIADGTGSGALSFNVGMTTVTLTGSDGSNTAMPCNFSVNVADNEPPVLTCPPNQLVNVNAGTCIGNYTIPDAISDNCPDSTTWTITLSGATSGSGTLPDGASSGPVNFNLDTTTVTLTGTDGTNNATSCSFIVVVSDNEVPVLSCPANQTINVIASTCAANYTIPDPISDNCPGSTWGYVLSGATTGSTAGIADGSSSGSISFNTGLTTVSLNGTDGANTASPCNFSVTVVDNEAPVIATCPANLPSVNVDLGLCTASGVGLGMLVATDNCAASSQLTISNNAPANFLLGLTVVTWTVSDTASPPNSATCMQSVTVNDTLNPTAICQDITIQLNPSGSVSINANQINNGSFDDCSGSISISVTPSSFMCASLGIDSAFLIVEDGDGNKDTCRSNVTVQDVTPPNAQCLSSLTIQLDSLGMAVVTDPSLLNNTSTDACGIAGFSLDMTMFDCSNLGPNPVVLTVSDSSSNSDTCHSTINVEDNFLPTALCEDSITVILDSNGIASVTGADIDSASFDACGIASLSVVPSTGNCANVGTTQVTLTVADSSGNMATCTAFVTVLEQLPPAAKCKATYTAQLNTAGTVTISGTDIDDGSTDNCGSVSLAVSPSFFDCDSVGTRIVTLSVTDTSGNSAICTSIVTVEDNVAPAANCTSATNTYFLDANGMVVLGVADIDNGSSDACGIASILISPDTLLCTDLGINTITLTVTDANNNPSTCTAVVNVIDNMAPSIDTMTCPPSQIIMNGTTAFNLINDTLTITTEPDNCLPTLTWQTPMASDNCGAASSALLDSLGVPPNNQFSSNGSTYTITYTATDDASPPNQGAPCSFMLRVQPQPFNIQDTSIQSISCFMAGDGFITVEVEGGCVPYTFSVSGTPITVMTSDSVATLGPLTPNTYTVMVVDMMNTSQSTVVTIDPPPKLALAIDTSMASIPCVGDSSGELSINIFAGTVPSQFRIRYVNIAQDTFLWVGNTTINSDTTVQLKDLPVGEYIHIITDANGCVVDSAVSVVATSDSLLTVSVRDTTVACTGANNGILIAKGSGGTKPYEYRWITGGQVELQTGDTARNLEVGDYIIIILDSNNCINATTAAITEKDTFFATVNDLSSGCSLDSFQPAVQLVFPPMSPFTSKLNVFPDGLSSIAILKGADTIETVDPSSGILDGEGNLIYNSIFQSIMDTGTYKISVVNDTPTTCRFTKEKRLLVPDAIDSVQIITTPDHDIDGDGTVEISVMDGEQPYNYVLTGVDSSLMDSSQFFAVNALESGQYIIQITDNNRCVYVDTVRIGLILNIEQPSREVGLLRVVPNPVSGISQIALKLNHSGQVQAELYSSKGNLLRHIDYGILSPAYHLLEFDFEQLSPAVYYLRIGAKHTSYTIKIAVVE